MLGTTGTTVFSRLELDQMKSHELDNTREHLHIESQTTSADPPADTPNTPPPPVSPQLLLQRLIGEVIALRNEVSSDLRPEVVKAGEILKSLEAYIAVGLGRRLAEELKGDVAAAFEAERAHARRTRRGKRVAVWALLLITIGLLAAEMSGDAVTHGVDRAVSRLAALRDGDGGLRFNEQATEAVVSDASAAAEGVLLERDVIQDRGKGQDEAAVEPATSAPEVEDVIAPPSGDQSATDADDVIPDMAAATIPIDEPATVAEQDAPRVPTEPNATVPLGNSPARSESAPEEDRSAVTSRVQGALNALGFDVGPPDGVLGTRTHAAIRAYQKAQGLPATGNIDDALLASLDIR